MQFTAVKVAGVNRPRQPTVEVEASVVAFLGDMISLSAYGFVVMPFNATGEIAAGDLRGLSNVAHRWHLPADSASNQGLGGGLGWVPASSNGGARRKSSTARSGSTTGAWDERP